MRRLFVLLPMLFPLARLGAQAPLEAPAHREGWYSRSDHVPDAEPPAVDNGSVLR